MKVMDSLITDLNDLNATLQSSLQKACRISRTLEAEEIKDNEFYIMLLYLADCLERDIEVSARALEMAGLRTNRPANDLGPS